jgi:glycosyltransferase involved in cell wall biosynthesis
MRILLLALDVNVKTNTGDAVHVRELAGSLATIGHQVSLVVPNTKGVSEEVDLLRDLDNLNLFFNSPNPRFRNLSTVLNCRKIAKGQKSEVIYERRFSPKVGYSLNKLLKIPLAVEINGLKDRERQLSPGGEISNPRFKNLRRKLWNHFFKSASSVVVVSDGLKKGLSEEYGIPAQKISVIYNGANTEIFKPLDKGQCQNDLGLDPDYQYVGFIGNLAPWQGVEQLVSITPAICKSLPNTKVVIVGEGMMGEKLRKLAHDLGVKDNIIFTGFVPYKKVPTYINAFDVCAAPFNAIERNVKYSFSAIKLYEYMACGKAVVTTDVCGIKDELRDLGMGIVVKADDSNALTSEIIELMSNKEKQRDMGAAAREWVVKEHSWKKVAERVASVCEGAVSGTTTI